LHRRFVAVSFGFLAISTTTLANSFVAMQSTPVFTAILSRIFLGEPWQSAEMVVVVAAAIGVCLMVQPDFLFAGVDDDAWTADLGGRGGEEEEAISSSSSSSSSRAGSPSRKDNTLGVIFALIGSLGQAGAYVMIRIMGTRVKVMPSVVVLSNTSANWIFFVRNLLLPKRFHGPNSCWRRRSPR
jgi:drug/metabolite transporter (DMT)-like permease